MKAPCLPRCPPSTHQTLVVQLFTTTAPTPQTNLIMYKPPLLHIINPRLASLPTLLQQAATSHLTPVLRHPQLPRSLRYLPIPCTILTTPHGPTRVDTIAATETTSLIWTGNRPHGPIKTIHTSIIIQHSQDCLLHHPMLTMLSPILTYHPKLKTIKMNPLEKKMIFLMLLLNGSNIDTSDFVKLNHLKLLNSYLPCNSLSLPQHHQLLLISLLTGTFLVCFIFRSHLESVKRQFPTFGSLDLIFIPINTSQRHLFS